jgi:hypothetical protein
MRSILLGIAGSILGALGGFCAGMAGLLVGQDSKQALSSDGSLDVFSAILIVGCFILTGAVLGAIGGGVCSNWHSRGGLLLGLAVGLVVGLGLMRFARPWAYAGSSGSDIANRLLVVTLGCLACVVIGAVCGKVGMQLHRDRRRSERGS